MTKRESKGSCKDSSHFRIFCFKKAAYKKYLLFDLHCMSFPRSPSNPFSQKKSPRIFEVPGVASVMCFLRNGIGVCDRWVENGRIDSVGSGQSAGSCCWGSRRGKRTSSVPRKLQSQAGACFGKPQLIHRPPDPAGT